jgi:hypothetical protein
LNLKQQWRVNVTRALPILLATIAVTMHELGHALGIGWADDTAPPWIGAVTAEQGMEVYSGDINGDHFDEDTTPEYLPIGPRWSIMRAGPAYNWGSSSDLRLAYSLEELSTSDFEEIPSVED